MAHSITEENTLCEDIQSIALHTTESTTDMSSEITHLSNQINTTSQQIKDKSNNSKLVYDNMLISLNDWRTEQLQQIEQIYQSHLQRILVKEQTLMKIHQEMLKYLKENATQHLERVQKQENSNLEVLYYIRHAIERVRTDSAELPWNFTIVLPNEIDISALNFSPIPSLVHKATSNTIKKEILSIF